MPKPINRQVELRELLEQLNLGGMAAIFAEVALRAAKEHLTPRSLPLGTGRP